MTPEQQQTAISIIQSVPNEARTGEWRQKFKDAINKYGTDTGRLIDVPNDADVDKILEEWKELVK